MSFSLKVKEELINRKYKHCCRQALLYGILMFSNTFTPKKIKIYTESFDIAVFISLLLQEVCNVNVDIEAKSPNEGGLNKIIIDDYKLFQEVFNVFSVDSFVKSSLTLDKKQLANECCVSSFLAGAFLLGGQIKDPNKEYYMEFETSKEGLSNDICSLLSELGYEPKRIVRATSYITYFKDSTVLEELLTFIGASKSAIEIMDVKIYKELRNETNRLVNCENANISKIVNASAQQFSSIEKLIKKKQLQFLSKQLQEIALLRYNNREASLSELGNMLTPKLSKSGVNHRLKKIIEIADKL